MNSPEILQWFEERKIVHKNLVALLAHEFNPLDSFFFGEVAREWNRVSDRFIQGPVSLKTKCLTIKMAVDSVPESAVASYFVRNGFVPDGRSAQVVVDTVLSQGLLQHGPTVEKHQRQLRAYLFDLIKRQKSIPIIPNASASLAHFGKRMKK